MKKANSVNPLPDRSRFFYLSVFWLFISVILVYFGVRYGPQILPLLEAEGKVDLQTMGELLGGALGVTVAFAGAWVAIKVARFAFQALDLQESREALETANEMLEVSVGAIRQIQSQCARLLREADELSRHVDESHDVKSEHEGMLREADHYIKSEEEQEEMLRDQVDQTAQRLANSIKGLLANPLALPVVFALQREREGDGGVARILQDLSQAPRWLSNLSRCVKIGAYNTPVSWRWASPFDAGLCLMIGRHSQLEAALSDSGAPECSQPKAQQSARDQAMLLEELSTERNTMRSLSYLSHITGEFVDSSAFDLREPRLIGLLRYFTYTPDEAGKALSRLFSFIYRTPGMHERVLEHSPARAFCIAGRSNDHLSDQQLRESRKITELLSSLLQQRSVILPLLKASVRSLGIVTPSVRENASKTTSLWLERNSARKLNLLMHWAGEWSEEKARNTKFTFFSTGQRALVDAKCYDNLVVQPLLLMLASELRDLSAFEAYRIVVDEYEASQAKADAAARFLFSISKSLQRARRASAERQLQIKIDEAIQQGRLRVGGATEGEGTASDMREELRLGAAKLCREAEEAGAFEKLMACQIPDREYERTADVFDELRNQLNRRLVDTLLTRSTTQEKEGIYQFIERDNLWPALLSRVCFILHLEASENSAEPLPARFRSVLTSCLSCPEPIKELAMTCLHRLHLQGASGSQYSSGNDFIEIVCELPGGIADDVVVEARLSLRGLKFDGAECAGEMAMSVCFGVQGKSLHDDDDAALRAALQAHFLGYANSSPEFPRPFHFTKTTTFEGNADVLLDATFLELRLIAQTYTADKRAA